MRIYLLTLIVWFNSVSIFYLIIQTLHIVFFLQLYIELYDYLINEYHSEGTKVRVYILSLEQTGFNKVTNFEIGFCFVLDQTAWEYIFHCLPKGLN
jgi:hypothetical protein